MKKLIIFLAISLLVVLSILLARTSFKPDKEPQQISDLNEEGLNKIKNVVLIIACSLSADHLSCYGYERKTSPNIDQLAKAGVQFKNCFAQAPFTVHSVASIMTSQYPRKLFGLDHDYAFIPDQAKTFAEFFQDEGFYTMGFMASPWTSKPFNFHQGFDYFFDTSELLERYKTEKERRANRVWGDELTKKIIDQLQKTKQKFFLQTMYTDVHWPYTSFPPFRGKYQIDKKRNPQVNRYDETILHFDAYVGQLIESLRKLNLLNDTLIIITSDHGEAFGKFRAYDIGHSAFLYNTVIKIPLIFYNPNLPIRGKLIDNYITSMDILPTTLDMIGIQYNQEDFDGSSQIRDFERFESPDTSERLIISETNFKHTNQGMKRSCAIWNHRWKLIHNYERTVPRQKNKLPAFELYDLKNDNAEMNNRIELKGDIAERLTLLFQGWQKENTLTLHKDINTKDLSIEHIDPEIKDQLKALGYID